MAATERYRPALERNHDMCAYSYGSTDDSLGKLSPCTVLIRAR